MTTVPPATVSILTAPTAQRRAATSKPAKKLTAGQVAELFGVRVETVRRWCEDGKLRCTRTLGGDRRFDADYIAQKLQDADAA
ncbi:HTH DNA binding protein [Exiguobacterium phage phiExGM16]|uniref:helix-turn-helix domain-containing protein n=1 Tax=Bacillati TaxID=1783272 RepID=UPI00325506E4